MFLKLTLLLSAVNWNSICYLLPICYLFQVYLNRVLSVSLGPKYYSKFIATSPSHFKTKFRMKFFKFLLNFKQKLSTITTKLIETKFSLVLLNEIQNKTMKSSCNSHFSRRFVLVCSFLASIRVFRTSKQDIKYFKIETKKKVN